ncbi:MAG: hypothetical protein JHC80_01480 [Polynucleobacter sp.]|jgi:hypothetical protein|nr:hypothetical protein [Polynucleobacter sp.]
MPLNQPTTKPIASWKIRLSYCVALLILLTVFALYFIPEVVVGLLNQAWALCGW